MAPRNHVIEGLTEDMTSAVHDEVVRRGYTASVAEDGVLVQLGEIGASADVFRVDGTEPLGRLVDDVLRQAGAPLDTGPFFHGTKAALQPGDLLEPGRASNFGAGLTANFIYFSASLDAATWGAELAAGDESGRIYEVEPTEPGFESDPNLTDARFPGNPTRSYRTRAALRVTREVADWEPHPPEVLQAMRDNVEQARRDGLEADNG